MSRLPLFTVKQVAKMAKKPAQGQLRIIGGQWRGRRFEFAEGPGLRPTPNRVRETLFNWLQAEFPGARVLDPFTGSGGLFLEALSRGAGPSLALDTNPQAVGQLRSNLQLLGGEQGHVERANALDYLSQPANQRYRVVFLDPPFGHDLLVPVCELLERQGWLQPGAWVYIESEGAPSALAMPDNWRLHREKHAGQVWYALWARS